MSQEVLLQRSNYLTRRVVIEGKPYLERVIDSSFGVEDQNDVEFQALSNLDHPKIPKLIECEGGVLRREWINGRTLRKCLEENKIFSRNDVINYGLQVLDILDYVHGKGIVHRDLKPENLILGDDDSMYVVDFGAVKLRYFSGKSTKRSVVGTFGYQAPEQFCGHAVPASDIYSLGAVMIEMLTGLGMEENYVDGRENLYTRRVVLPEEIDFGLRSVLQRMVEMDVSRRYKNVGEVRRDLESLSGDKNPVLKRRSHVYANLVVKISEHYIALSEGDYLKEVANNDFLMFLIASGFEIAESRERLGFYVRDSGQCLEVLVHDGNKNLDTIKYAILKERKLLTKFIDYSPIYLDIVGVEVLPINTGLSLLFDFWRESYKSPELLERIREINDQWERECALDYIGGRGLWNFCFHRKRRNKVFQRINSPATREEIDEWKPYLGKIAVGIDAFESIVFANSQR